MSVVSSHLWRSGRRVRITSDGGIVGLHHYGADYLVITDDPTDEGLVVIYQGMSAGPDPIPGYRSVYDLGDSTDFSSFAQDYDAAQGGDNHAKVWRVSVGWSPLGGGELSSYTGAGGSPIAAIPFDDPLNKPDRHWVEQETYTREVQYDALGNPILNAAGFPYPHSPTIKEYRREVYTWVKRFATAGAIRALNRTHALSVNATSFAGYDPGKALCWPILRQQIMNQNGQTFYEATIRVACQEHTWQEVKQELGYKHWAWSDGVGDPGSTRVLVDATDFVAGDMFGEAFGGGAAAFFPGTALQPVTEPVPLIPGTNRPNLKGFREYEFDDVETQRIRVSSTTWPKYRTSELNDLGVDIAT